MDKTEFRERMARISACLNADEYDEALDLLDSINWRKLHNVNLLLEGAQLYEKAGKLDDAKELLEIAHDRSPIGRMIIYRLANICAAAGDIEEAKSYYQKFIELAPGDNLKYIIKYNINKAQGADDFTLITILEDLRANELIEEWAFELACLYRKKGQVDKCIGVLDEIILWFGEGPYVEKAYEMKLLYKPLTKDQEIRYRRMTSAGSSITEIRPGDSIVAKNEILGHTIRIPEIEESSDRFNTMNLQAEIRKNIEEIMRASEVEEVNDNLDAINDLVEYIPYLQEEEEIPETTEREQLLHDTRRIDRTLKNKFKEYLSEEFDGQISLNVPMSNSSMDHIAGQLTIEDIVDRWERTRRAAELALSDAKEHELLAYKQRAIAKAGTVLERLRNIEDREQPGQRTFPIPKIHPTGEKGGVGLEIPIIPKEDAGRNRAFRQQATQPLPDISDITSAQEVFDLAEEDLTIQAPARAPRVATGLIELAEESLTKSVEIPTVTPQRDLMILSDESLTNALPADFMDEEIKKLKQPTKGEVAATETKVSAPSASKSTDLADESLTGDIPEDFMKAEQDIAFNAKKAATLMPESLEAIDLVEAQKNYELVDESLTEDIPADFVTKDEVIEAQKATTDAAVEPPVSELVVAKIPAEIEEKEIDTTLPEESLTAYLRADFIYSDTETKVPAAPQSGAPILSLNDGSTPSFKLEDESLTRYLVTGFIHHDIDMKSKMLKTGELPSLDAWYGYEDQYPDTYPDDQPTTRIILDEELFDDETPTGPIPVADVSASTYTPGVQATQSTPGSRQSIMEAQDALKDINNMLQREIDKLMGTQQFDEETIAAIEEATGRIPKIMPILPTEFTPRQREILTYFADMSGMEEPLVKLFIGAKDALQKRNTHRRGNVVIMGDRGFGKTKLATDIVKILQTEIGLPAGNIGRISGAKLNEKDVEAIFEKIRGGALIIEDAGDLTYDTMLSLNGTMETDDSGVLVIIEGTRPEMENLFRQDASFASKFTEKIRIPVMTIDELVNFGRYYAAENGYAIDEMGILALYDNINLATKPNAPAKITDVKAILDEAISRQQSTKFKGILDLFGSKTHSGPGLGILQEKDFREN